MLQIINHLQDCGKDYRALNRVYLPQDCLAANGANVEALAAGKASAGLLATLHQLTQRTESYFDSEPPLSDAIRDTRLACEVAVITALARRLIGLLKVSDPLADKVHLGRASLMATMIGATAGTLIRRIVPGSAPQRHTQDLRS